MNNEFFEKFKSQMEKIDKQYAIYVKDFETQLNEMENKYPQIASAYYFQKAMIAALLFDLYVAKKEKISPELEKVADEQISVEFVIFGRVMWQRFKNCFTRAMVTANTQEEAYQAGKKCIENMFSPVE